MAEKCSQFSKLSEPKAKIPGLIPKNNGCYHCGQGLDITVGEVSGKFRPVPSSICHERLSRTGVIFCDALPPKKAALSQNFLFQV